MEDEREPDLSEFEYAMRLSQASILRSRDREKLIEHVFISEILQESWFVREQPLEVLKSEVDAYGYDLVLECNGVTRHIQLKASQEGGSTRRQSVNRLLEQKVGGCVVWVLFEHDWGAGRIRLSYLYFGGRRPRDRMPSLGDELARNPRSKAPRPNARILSVSKFERIPTTSALLDRLFGRAKPVTGPYRTGPVLRAP
jgi:hypothetical protein